MADIAVIMMQPIPILEAMELEDLGFWHAKAIDRYNRMNGKE